MLSCWECPYFEQALFSGQSSPILDWDIRADSVGVDQGPVVVEGLRNSSFSSMVPPWLLGFRTLCSFPYWFSRPERLPLSHVFPNSAVWAQTIVRPSFQKGRETKTQIAVSRLAERWPFQICAHIHPSWSPGCTVGQCLTYCSGVRPTFGGTQSGPVWLPFGIVLLSAASVFFRLTSVVS